MSTTTPKFGWSVPELTDAANILQISTTLAPAIENTIDSLANPTTWTAVTFANSWVDFGTGNQVCQYRKVGDMVQVRGLMKSGTIGAAAFTLPAGFRPPATLIFASEANSLFSVINIDSAGVFTPLTGSNVYFSVNCTFSVTA